MNCPGQHRQQGVVVIVVGMAIFVLIGFIGLAVDLGHLFVVKAEMQNSMDACALAAAKELTGISGNQLHIAENAGITVGSRNSANFQSQAVGLVPDDITFSATLGGTYQTRTVVEASGTVLAMKYVKCERPQSGIAMNFIAAVGVFGPQTVTAHAVATLAPSQTACGIPLAMCSKTSPPASCPPLGSGPSLPPDTFGHCPGQWYDGKFEAGGGATGNFNWIDFTPPAGGASEMGGLLSGPGQCNTSTPNPVGQTGVTQANANDWNSRFGLYKSGAGNPSAATSPPDFTGYSYTATNWTTQFNAYAGAPVGAATNFQTKRAAYASYGDTVDTVDAGNTITGLSISNSYNVATHGPGGQLASSGASRRVEMSPIVDCSGWASSQTVSVAGWACILLLHPLSAPGDTVWLEYIGSPSAPGSPCSSTGLAGGPGSVGPLVPVLVR